MPANLTPSYHKAEEEYRRAQTAEEELRCLQLMLAEMPKHKGTDHLQADLKTKIAQAKKDMAVEKSSKKGGRLGVRIPRQGAGTVVILGGPNAGKSQFLKTMTRATPEVAAYPFTTTTPMPGMMPWQDVFVQLIDMPPITKDFFESYVQGIIRSADLALLMIDLGDDAGVEQCQELLERLQTTKTRLASESYLDEDDVGLSYTRTFVVPNKIDADGAADRLELFHELIPLDWREFVISAADGTGIEPLRDAIYHSLDVVRVYSKMPKAKQADMDKPFTLRVGSTMVDLANEIHKDIAASLKFGRVWGEAVHDGTPMKGDYVLHDKDIVELNV